MKARFFMIALFVLNIFQMSAQSNDEVTLVVSADGATKEEATKVALRSAIEQAYGTFVSANTTILNDEIVKDEIVTLSTGNVKNYKELSSNLLQDGRTYLTLQATISLSNLTRYAQNKGATTEFAGSAFGMNIKMMELNKKNEKIILHHMQEKLCAISHLFDFTLKLDEPYLADNGMYGIPKEVASRYYFVNGKISLYYNKNTELYNEILYNTVKSVALSFNDYQEYEKKGITLNPSGKYADGESIFLRNSYNFNRIIGPYNFTTKELFMKDLHLEDSSEPEIYVFTTADMNLNEYEWKMFGWDVLAKGALSFTISDNISSPSSLNIFYRDLKFYKNLWSYKKSYTENLFTKKKKEHIIKTKVGDKVGELTLLMAIPKEDISKYNQFKIK